MNIQVKNSINISRCSKEELDILLDSEKRANVKIIYPNKSGRFSIIKLKNGIYYEHDQPKNTVGFLFKKDNIILKLILPKNKVWYNNIGFYSVIKTYMRFNRIKIYIIDLNEEEIQPVEVEIIPNIFRE